jgi:membrane protein
VRTTPPFARFANRKALERAFRLGRRFARGLMDHDAFGAAASIAFWLFLSLVPLLVIVGFLVGQVARARGVDALVGTILEVVPGTAEGLVGKELQRLAGASASSIAPLGVAGFLWTASSGLHNLMDVFETAAHVRRRAWWKQRVLAIGWVLLGLATACVLAWLLVKTDTAMHAHEPPVTPSSTAAARSSPTTTHGVDRAPQARSQAAGTHADGLRRRVDRALRAPDEPLIAAVLLLATSATLLAGFYRYAVEHPPGVRRRAWPGAVAAMGSWVVVSWGFGDYAVSIADYALYYGSLAAVAVLLVWLYLTSLSLVVGAEVNAQLEGLRDER